MNHIDFRTAPGTQIWPRVRQICEALPSGHGSEWLDRLQNDPNELADPTLCPSELPLELLVDRFGPEVVRAELTFILKLTNRTVWEQMDEALSYLENKPAGGLHRALLSLIYEVGRGAFLTDEGGEMLEVVGALRELEQGASVSFIYPFSEDVGDGSCVGEGYVLDPFDFGLDQVDPDPHTSA